MERQKGGDGEGKGGKGEWGKGEKQEGKEEEATGQENKNMKTITSRVDEVEECICQQ